jgi:hypothetical protein
LECRQLLHAASPHVSEFAAHDHATLGEVVGDHADLARANIDSGGDGSSDSSGEVRRWSDPTITFSFMPDATPIVAERAAESSLLAVLSQQIGPAETWQRDISRALQTWAAVTPLNFVRVADDGSAFNAPGLVQHDERFGDIRIGGYTIDGRGGSLAHGYFPSSSGATAPGDIHFDTAESWSIGGATDLFTAFLHEVGHALGLPHIASPGSVMSPSYNGSRSGLAADDVGAIRGLYGSRTSDAFAGNSTFATAHELNGLLDSDGAVTLTGDLTTATESDFFRFTAPARGTLDVQSTSDGISLLDSRILVFDSQRRLVAWADSSDFGKTESIQIAGVTPGATYTIVADGSDTSVFAVGTYTLRLHFQADDATTANLESSRPGAACVSNRLRVSSARTASVVVEPPGGYPPGWWSVRVIDQRLRTTSQPNDGAELMVRANRPQFVEVRCEGADEPPAGDLGGQISLGRDGVLQVIGTADDDMIAARSPNEVVLGNTHLLFTTSSIRGIRVRAGAGDDFIAIASQLTIPIQAFGGVGNDVLLGGGGNDLLAGDHGRDLLWGGAGADRLIGGLDDDFIDDGDGDDVVFTLGGFDFWLRGRGKNTAKGTPREVTSIPFDVLLDCLALDSLVAELVADAWLCA